MCMPVPESQDLGRESHETNGVVVAATETPETIVEDATGPVCPPPTMAVIATFVRDLPVEITGDEFHRVAMELGATFDEIAREALHQDQQKAAMKERLAALVLKQHTLAKALGKGVETRPVDVERVAYYDTGIIVERRRDTLEELSRRPMKDDERQLPLSAEVAARAAEVMVEHSSEHETA